MLSRTSCSGIVETGMIASSDERAGVLSPCARTGVGNVVLYGEAFNRCPGIYKVHSDGMPGNPGAHMRVKSDSAICPSPPRVTTHEVDEHRAMVQQGGLTILMTPEADSATSVIRSPPPTRRRMIVNGEVIDVAYGRKATPEKREKNRLRFMKHMQRVQAELDMLHDPFEPPINVLVRTPASQLRSALRDTSPKVPFRTQSENAISDELREQGVRVRFNSLSKVEHYHPLAPTAPSALPDADLRDLDIGNITAQNIPPEGVVLEHPVLPLICNVTTESFDISSERCRPGSEEQPAESLPRGLVTSTNPSTSTTLIIGNSGTKTPRRGVDEPQICTQMICNTQENATRRGYTTPRRRRLSHCPNQGKPGTSPVLFSGLPTGAHHEPLPSVDCEYPMRSESPALQKFQPANRIAESPKILSSPQRGPRVPIYVTKSPERPQKAKHRVKSRSSSEQQDQKRSEQNRPENETAYPITTNVAVGGVALGNLTTVTPRRQRPRGPPGNNCDTHYLSSSPHILVPSHLNPNATVVPINSIRGDDLSIREALYARGISPRTARTPSPVHDYGQAQTRTPITPSLCFPSAVARVPLESAKSRRSSSYMNEHDAKIPESRGRESRTGMKRSKPRVYTPDRNEIGAIKEFSVRN